MRTWNDITIGTPIYLLTSRSGNILKINKLVCINIENNNHYTMFKYKSVTDNTEGIFGIMKGDLGNNKHYGNARKVVFYSDIEVIKDKIHQNITDTNTEIQSLNSKIIHYNDILQEINIISDK